MPLARRCTTPLALSFALATLATCKVGKETTVPGHDVRWRELDFAAKTSYMRDVVTPEMKRTFQAFDAKRFADFGCGTCHGSGHADGTYTMPNPDLPHLREKGFFREHRKAHPATVKFMWKQVEKPLGKLMGLSYGPKGEMECGNCHIVDDRKD